MHTLFASICDNTTFCVVASIIAAVLAVGTIYYVRRDQLMGRFCPRLRTLEHDVREKFRIHFCARHARYSQDARDAFERAQASLERGLAAYRKGNYPTADKEAAEGLQHLTDFQRAAKEG